MDINYRLFLLGLVIQWSRWKYLILELLAQSFHRLRLNLQGFRITGIEARGVSQFGQLVRIVLIRLLIFLVGRG